MTEPHSLNSFTGSFSQALKAFDQLIKEHDASASVQLLCNRAFCYERLQLNRKALKDYEAALQKEPTNLQILLRQGKVLHALRRTQEAKQLWERAAAADLLSSDLALVLEAQALLQNPNGNAAPPAATPLASLAATPMAPVPSPKPAAVGQVLPASQPPAGVPAPSEPTASSATELQAAHPTANGTSSPKTAQKVSAKARARNQLSPELLLLIEKDPNQAVGIAVNQINEGKVVEAEGLLCRILEKAPPHAKLGAYVARGTARALARNLQPAVDDFSKAIALEPRYADCWKRRGQARSALGENEAALQDLRKAADLTADRTGKADCQLEAGMILQKQKDYRAATAAFEAATRLDPRNVQAVNMLGLCYTSQGDLQDGIKAYEKALRLDPGLKDAWFNLATAHKEIGNSKEAEKAFAHSIKLRGDRESAVAMRMVAELRRGCGGHMSATQILDRALAATPPYNRIELLFLRGACYHALGFHRSAARDYSQAFTIEQKDSSNEVKMQQFLAFYQRELALYTYRNLDRKFSTYFTDKDIDPVFKESWCKKGPPPPQLLTASALQPPFPAKEPEPLAAPNADDLAKLLTAADAIGNRLRYRHQGFLANKRQLRMGGLAAIELAQMLRTALSHRRANHPLRVPNDGASGERSASGSHAFGWRDAMDILVRWRQLSEPNDQVLWVDLLTKQEFEAGFGSHTPIFSGQTKCVRYYMNFERALGVFKEVLLRDGRGFDAHNIAVLLNTEAKRKAVAAATTAEELWKAMGVDCWAVVPIASVHRAGHDLEGTRLTVVRLGDMPNGYEVSIRTPVTPPRWEDFHEELTSCWGALMEALAAGDRPEVARRALHFAYYWYNFMPLARGSAVVGAMTVLAVFLAAGMPVTASIPPGYQTDWEAILSQSVEPFIESVSPWLYPPEARGEAASSERPFPPLEELPSVEKLLSTMRARLEALNGPDVPRIHTDQS